MNRIKILTICLVALLAGIPAFADDASTRFSTAKTAFDSKQYEAARSGFDAFLSQYPSHAQANEATFYLAESLMYLGQYPRAETYYTRLASLGLDNQFARVALFRLGDILYIQGRYDLAKPKLEDFVDKLPHDNNLQFVLYYLGDIAMRAGSAVEAEWYFGQSDRIFPEGAKNTESKLGLAWAKNKLGKQTEANAIYQQLMVSANSSVVEQATYQWGVALFERGEFQNAITSLTDFQRRYPTSLFFTDSQRVMARCKGGLADFDGALAVLSLISQPTPDDKLMKVRCLYGLKRMPEAKAALDDAERTAGAAYRDEIALLKSVFLFDQKDWRGTIATLESVLFPQYDAQNNKMMFNYSSLTPTSGINKLSDEAFFKACSLLTLAYAQNGDTAKATATLNEMQEQATVLGGSNLYAICTDTATRLASAGNKTPGRGQGQWQGGYGQTGQGNLPQYGSTSTGQGSGQGYNRGNSGNRNKGQWSPSGTGQGSLQALQPVTSGTDLDRFWRGMQLFEGKNYTAAVQQLEQIISGQYNVHSTPKQYYVFYNITGADGTLDAATFAKTCSMIAVAKAQLGDLEQANAVLTTMASRVLLTDNVQKNLLLETQNQLALIAKNGGVTTLPGTVISLLSESEQKKLLRDANSQYKAKKYDQAETSLADLISKKPADNVLSEALLIQSKTKYKLGKEQEGIKILERITDEFTDSPQYPDALWYLGLYYDSYGDAAQSVEYFQIIADKFPNFTHIDGALYFLALYDLENSGGRKATTYLTRIYKNYQNGLYWSHAAWQLAYESYKKKEYAQADIYLLKILQHPPDVVILDRVLYLKGELALKKNEYETAFMAFREIGKLCPESPLCSAATRNAQLAAGKTVTR